MNARKLLNMIYWIFVQVLKTGHEIMELEVSGLYTQGPTVFAGNIGNNQFVIQVSAHGIRLLEGSKELTWIYIGKDLVKP
jgi:hypothetical protein